MVTHERQYHGYFTNYLQDEQMTKLAKTWMMWLSDLKLLKLPLLNYRELGLQEEHNLLSQI